MRQWLGVPANVAPNTRRTQFINHANYKIIYLNVIDWANATKIHTPPICQTLFPLLTNMRCTKTISPPGMASYRKSLLTPHRSMMEMCCSCFMDTKYKCLRCSSSCRLWYTVLRAVCNASLLFLFFAINCQSKALRALYSGISLTTPSSN